MMKNSVISPLCLTSHKRDISKQHRPRSDAAGCTLFAITLESFNNKSNYDDFYKYPFDYTMDPSKVHDALFALKCSNFYKT